MSSDSSSVTETASLLASDDESTGSAADYLVPARRWRPRTFAELIGQEPVVKALQNGLNANRVHHAFLFTGTRGTGKTTLARILAKCLNCETGVSADPCGVCAACLAIDAGRFIDLIEVDAASRTRVEDTRELLDNVQFAPTSGRYKIYLIDEVHMLSGHSFNALLKTLEEPPPHVKFILATTDPQKLPVTILSRCLRFNLRRVDADVLSAFMHEKLQQEGLDIDATGLGFIATAADGSVRDGLSLLDQALSYTDGTLQPEAVKTMLGMVSDEYMSGLLQALAEADAATMLQVCAEINAAGNSPDRVLAQLAQALHRISVLQMLPDQDTPEQAHMALLQTMSERLSVEDVQLFYQIAIKGQEDLKLAPDPRIGLEMTLLRMLVFQPDAAHSTPNPGNEDNTLSAAGDNGNGQQHAATRQNDAAPDPRPDALQAITQEQTHKSSQTTTMPNHAAATADDLPAQPHSTAWHKLTPQRWPQLFAKLGLQGPALLLASHLHLHAVDHDSATLQFKLAADDLHLRNDDSIEELQQSLAAGLQMPCRIQIDISHESLTTPASEAAAADDARHEQALLAVQQDPAINAMIQAFDAEIVPGSVKPSTLH